MTDLTAGMPVTPFVSCKRLASPVKASCPPASTENVILVLKVFSFLFIL